MWGDLCDNIGLVVGYPVQPKKCSQRVADETKCKYICSAPSRNLRFL